jgi:hypothetical protein
MHRRFVLGALAGGLMLSLGLSAAIAQPAPSPAGQSFTDQKRAVKRLRRTEKKLIKRRKRKAKELLKRRRDEHVRVHL